MTDAAQNTDDRPSRVVLARRVIGFDDTVGNRAATTCTRTPFGMLRMTPDIPKVHGLSGMTIDRPVAVTELITAAATLQAGRARQRLSTTHAEVAWSVGPALVDRGWTLERLVYMVRDADAAVRVSAVGFVTVDAQAFQAYASHFFAEQPGGNDPVVVQQLGQRDARLQDSIGARFVMSRDGQAGCHVYRHGSVAQIEEVGVLTESRGQGLGIGLMAAAIAECGDAETIFVIADTDDWPRAWYRRMGFVEVASAWHWHLDIEPG